MKVVAIAVTDLRRLFRWRANIFFLFVLPMLIILLLGAAFGGSNKARIGVTGGRSGLLAQQLVAGVRARPSIQVVRLSGVSTLEHAVAHGNVDAGIVIPRNYDARLDRGAAVTIGYLARPASVAQQLRTTIQSVVAEQGRAFAAALLLRAELKTDFAAALARARAAAARAPRVRVVVSDPGGGPYTSGTGRFQSGASTQLLLFIFLNSLSGAAWVIETRRLGIARRMLSTPTSTRTVVAGQILGRFVVALFQALIIVLGTLLLFGVDWGDPLGTATLIVAFCLVGTGAALLVGSLFDNEQQAGPVALLLGLGLAALGGSMVPLEVFPNSARELAHITPHAWANDAFSKLLQHGGDVITVLPQIGVLLGFAAVLTGLAVWQPRRALTA
jgi:ABC-2 type transport system permease protein